MGFWYDVPIPSIGDSQSATVRIVRWLVEEGGPVQRGTRIAIIETSIGHFAVTTNGDGFLREKLFPAGSVIEARNSIAVVAADGENIPYNRPYSQAERVDAIG